ncbi:HNH endonuclease [Methylicorpusculum oleiharenae]|uniref:HNH endonuclease signature motif containing protein n=1 Tax=Methylicorpusculum oleiharenae TaxID=1338687 RepID=UPI001356BE2A|nr:HNH endonuclease signature motif containing protein [Methylicorpusculum oleiharenae]MCD2453779.1 HNH endonuclease [Methylicorpusculum oleiharenae]
MAENWSDEELAAAVDAYKEMAHLEANQKPYSKRKYYRDLVERFGRTEKSFEYRMQNISAVLHEQGDSWIPGLKPAGNVGANVKPRIKALLNINNLQKRPSDVKKAAYKKNLSAMREWLIEVARSKEKVLYSEMMQVFDIDRFSLRHAMDYLGHQSDNLDEPIITALIVSKGTGRCSVGFSKEFEVRDDEVERHRLYEYWANNSPTQSILEPSPTDLKAKALRFAIVASRPDQAAFRREVYEACGGRCVISGCDVDKVLDAAHKHGRDWRLGHNKAEDGYLLRKDLHALYDKNLLTIADDGVLSLAPEALDHYKDYAGKKLP